MIIAKEFSFTMLARNLTKEWHFAIFHQVKKVKKSVVD
jgi:hypothetical protein